MVKKYNKAIYLFNRDIRIQDNELLTNATQSAQIVYPIFIFTPKQVQSNKYINHHAITFMATSLLELSEQIPLCFFYGDNIEILEKLCKLNNIDVIFNNMDVTPFAIQRSKRIKDLCKKNNIDFIEGKDIFLGRHNLLTKKDGNPYLKFTPFYNNAVSKILKEEIIVKPNLSVLHKISSSQNTNVAKKYINKKYLSSVFIPGRKSAENALNKFIKSDVNYLKTRDLPSLNSTSHLSAYLHHGVLGPVEIMNELKENKNNKEVVRQLIWREFYLYIIWMQHNDYSKKSRTISANNKIKWRKSTSDYKKWCEGKTGCPIVDAGMRELNETGYMQNRLRMIVAMYLTFYLQLDWTLGEKYFAQNLVDYDYCNNLGGWLWSSGWEVHSNEYYRVFSMSSQMKRFDNNADYVKKWIPELKEIPAKDLYDWDLNYTKYSNIKYVEPIFKNLGDARKDGLNIYKNAHK
jgi:deoxyribodipyrimidine photo-lyase